MEIDKMNNTHLDINIYVLTDNQWLMKGLEWIINKVSSQYLIARVRCCTHQITNIENLLNAIIRTEGTALVIFSSENYFTPNICSVINEIKDLNIYFKSILLCHKSEKEKFQSVFNAYFDTTLEQSISIFNIEMAVGMAIKSIIDDSDTSRVKNSGIPEAFKPFLKLTHREATIIHDIFRGRDTKYIAEKLFISEKTVYVHRSRIYSKFNVHSLSELYFLMKNSSIYNF